MIFFNFFYFLIKKDFKVFFYLLNFCFLYIIDIFFFYLKVLKVIVFNDLINCIILLRKYNDRY